MLETWVQSLVWEEPLEKGMATHSSILAWRIPWTEKPRGLHTAHGVAKSQMMEQLTHTQAFLGLNQDNKKQYTNFRNSWSRNAE